MITVWLQYVVILGLSVTIASSDIRKAKQKPHIVVIVADDLGWNDVSWHNPRIKTPNLELLAKDGIILKQSYVQPVCTPTRAALLSGRYPYTIGRQGKVIHSEDPTGVTIKIKLLPEVLKELGYSTHIVGKWHLGFCSWDYTPTKRGFDTFWGHYNGAEDYYYHSRPLYDGLDKELIKKLANDSRFGYDFWNNTMIDWSVYGKYSTEAYVTYIEDLLRTRNVDKPMFLYLALQSVHGPMQVPKKYEEPFSDIKHNNRRIYYGMVSAMDDAVGKVVKALKKTGHYNNTFMVFTTDNGGAIHFGGNNWPLKGCKNTLYEGGTRGVAFVNSPLLPKTSKGTTSNKLIHVTDWYNTLVALGGGAAPNYTNGYDQWLALTKPTHASPRREMIYNIMYDEHGIQAGIRKDDYKLLLGFSGPEFWVYPPEGESDHHQATKAMGSLKAKKEEKPLNQEFRPSTSIQEALRLDELMDTCISQNVEYMGNSSSEIEQTLLSMEKYLDDSSRLHHADKRGLFKYDRPKIVTLKDLELSNFGSGTLGTMLKNDTVIRLFNLKDDPIEKTNLAIEEPSIVKNLLIRLQSYMDHYVKPDIPPKRYMVSNPVNWGNIWSPGWCKAK